MKQHPDHVITENYGPGSVVLRCSCKSFSRSFPRHQNAMARVAKQNAARREHLRSLNGESASVPAEKKVKRHRYNVGVRKEYFPSEIHPPAKEMTAWFASFKVLATSRTDAAQKVWAKEGAALRAKMLPNRQKVALEVNDPVRKIFAGRIAPITVYCEHIFNDGGVCRFCRQKKELMK